MKKITKAMSGILAAVGLIASGAASVGCLFIFVDEPEAPASIIN